MANKEFSITKQIDAADTTSKIFCHYMKNEILAIQSEIELLNPSPENVEGIQEVLNRCNHLYERLDTIHRGTKTSELNLVETDLCQFVTNILESMKINLRSCDLAVIMEEDTANVMLDRMYFDQALKNIIENALDAMEAIPLGQRKLSVRLQRASNWIVLSIQDTGIGIPNKNMKNIFTPLYSSKPIAKHWGIGLALAHRIIMAHDGKIEVESQENVGTNFKIFLPDMGKYIS
jgi:signal transduction histidine kinase